ncbi:MAG TPA: YciI family protein [Stenotrophomonas sp.]|nr:YciI family protein [Stenotrophomonas sp.]
MSSATDQQASPRHYLVLAMRKPGYSAAVIQPHREFLAQLRADGKLLMTGGFADASGGAYVLQGVASLAEARALVARDPLALQDASELTVYEWNTY